MKKSLILLTVLLLAGTLAFAVDVTPEWSIDLSAYTTVGYDLNQQAGGIQTDATTDFRFSYWPKATWSKGGEGLYGYIEVKDLTFSLIKDKWDKVGPVGTFENDYYDTNPDAVKNDAGTVTAKVVWNSLYFLVSMAVDDMGFDYAKNTDGWADVNFMTLKTYYGNEGTIGFGFANDMIKARLTILSEGDYATIPLTAAVVKTDPSAFFTAGKAKDGEVTGRTVNLNNDYAFGLWVVANPMAMLALDVKGIYALDDYAGFGGMISLKPIDLISFDFGADFYSDLDSLSYFDMKPALTLHLGDDSLTASMYYGNYPVVGKTDNEIRVSAKFVEADADAGYVPGLGASAELTLVNLTPVSPAKLEYTVDVKANYTIGAWMPYAEFKMSPNTVNDAQRMKVNAGITFTGIANTTVTLDYVADDLGNKEPGTYNDKGIIYLKTKIAY